MTLFTHVLRSSTVELRLSSMARPVVQFESDSLRAYGKFGSLHKELHMLILTWGAKLPLRIGCIN